MDNMTRPTGLQDYRPTFERLHSLLFRKGPKALKKAFDAIHPPDKLVAALEENKTSLQKLRPRVINDERWELLFPPAGKSPDSTTFDMKLLVILLENICGLQPPEKGWEKMPPHMDRSLQANVTRIKLIQKKVNIRTVTSTETDEAAFELDAMWTNVSETLVEMGILQKEIDVFKRENLVLWKWKQNSKAHQEKFRKLLEHVQENPEEVIKINGVRLCCSTEFLIGKGDDGTRVYVGLEKDGSERAVKRYPKDGCTSLAEHEKGILEELNNHFTNVLKYWFYDNKSDRNFTFLILDICEETLENYVHRESLDYLAKTAPEIIPQVLNGLAALHGHPPPILHRDIKPSNILRNIGGNWLLSDFGISRIMTGDAHTYKSKPRGTFNWIAVESYPIKDESEDNHVRYKKESDIQVAGMVVYYLVTKGKHPFGEEADRLRNLLDGKPVGLDSLLDHGLKDLLSWMLSHDPNDRPLAEEALKHPYLQTAREKFEMLCKVGNEVEIKTGDVNSDVVQQLNSDSTDWMTKIKVDVRQYLCMGSVTKRTFHNGSSWTECLQLISNVDQLWKDRPRPLSQPEAFYLVGDPQEYFLKIFPNLPVMVHRIVRSSDWKERPQLQKCFKSEKFISELDRCAQNRDKETGEKSEETSSNDTLYRSVHEMLTEQLNDNCDWGHLEKEVEQARTSHDKVEVSLIGLLRLIKYCIRKGDHTKAEEKLNEYNAILPACTPEELDVFEVIELYLRCFMERSKGNYEKSYKIVKSSLKKVKNIQPGIVSTEFYALAATVINILAMKTEDLSERNRLLSKAKDVFFKALCHLQEVRKNKFIKADLEQKLHTNLAMIYLGSCLAGDKLSDFHAQIVDQTEAQNHLDKINRTVIYKNIPLSRYREIQHHLALSDLFYLASKSEETRKDYLLKQALKFAEQAKALADVGSFPEMVRYAQDRVALILEEKVLVTERLMEETRLSREVLRSAKSEKSEETSSNDALHSSLHEMLTERLNDNCEWGHLEKEVEQTRASHNKVEVSLICLSTLIKYCIRKGDHTKAEEKLNEYNAILPACTPEELDVFEVIELYLRCFMERSKGNYEKSYEIVKSSLKKVKNIKPGIVSTEFYTLAATVINILAMNTKDLSERKRLLSKAKDVFYKALRHLQEVRTSKFVKTDLEQKLHTNLAMFHSGSCLAGCKLTAFHAQIVDQAEAQNHLDKINRTVIYENIPLSRYREIQHHLALSDLFYLASKSEETAKKNYLLKQALKFAEQAQYLAKAGDFPEMNSYAKNRVTSIQKETENTEPWKWEQTSLVHREKFEMLLKYGRENPEEVMEVNGVRVCCSKDCLIGMGYDGTRVYVGLEKDGSERAVKRLPKDACASTAEHEMRIFNTIQSNHVVRYRFFDDESDKNYVFLTLDLCEETLESYVHRESLDHLTRDAPGIIRHVLKALADLHRNPTPILHRDLKPSNILRNVRNEWLLADFGISQVLTADARTHTRKPIGTLLWQAVESRDSEDNEVCYREESDIQVAGMIAYYIVTKGKHPFGEDADRLRNLLDGKPVGLDSLSDPALKDFLSRMLSRNPNDRPSAQEALEHPYLQTAEEKFEMLCKVGNEVEIKDGDVNSEVVQQLSGENDETLETTNDAQNLIPVKQDETATRKTTENEDPKKKRNFLEETFLDKEYSIKKEIHEMFKSFSWLRGAYGITRPNKNIPHLHFYATVESGKPDSEVYQEIKEAFHKLGVDFEPKEYCELFWEAEEELEIQYLVAPGCVGTIGAEDEDASAKGTLTMFCCQNQRHYALTPFHVGCMTHEDFRKRPINLRDMVKIRRNLDDYITHVKRQQYYYNEREIAKGENSKGIYSRLGNVHKTSMDAQSDIMSIEVPEGVRIYWKRAHVETEYPNWEEVHKEIYKRAYEDQVQVEKDGISTDTTHGYIIEFNYSDTNGKIEEAIVVKSEGTFLGGGDSGALVWFHDEKEKKSKAFAYGVATAAKLGGVLRNEKGPFYICLKLRNGLESLELLH